MITIRNIIISAFFIVALSIWLYPEGGTPADPAVINARIKELASTSGQAIDSGAHGLGAIGAPALPYIIEAYKKPLSPSHRHNLVYAALFIRGADEQSNAFLVSYLDDESSRLSSYYSDLRSAANPPRGNVGRFIFNGGNNQPPPVRPPVMSYDMRLAAMERVSRCRYVPGVGPLADSLRADPPANSLYLEYERQVRRKASRLLCRYLESDKPALDAVNVLESLLEDKDKECTRWATYGLGLCRYKNSLVPLCGLVTSTDKALAEYAASALGNIGEKDALNAVKKCLRNTGDAYVKAAAQAAITDIAGESVPFSPTATADGLPLARSFIYPARDYAKDSSRKSFGIIAEPGQTPDTFHKFGNKIHVGDDSAWFQDGATVCAIADGIVRYAADITVETAISRSCYAWGGLVVIEHRAAGKEKGQFRALCSVYGHLSGQLKVKPGQLVQKGQKLGELGLSYGIENGDAEARLHLGLYDGAYQAETGQYPDWLDAYTDQSQGIGKWLDPLKFLSSALR
ncbi:MAG: HEAT repeat domain-containing protein [Candidatus Brocadiia bacterium]